MALTSDCNVGPSAYSEKRRLTFPYDSSANPLMVSVDSYPHQSNQLVGVPTCPNPIARMPRSVVPTKQVAPSFGTNVAPNFVRHLLQE